MANPTRFLKVGQKIQLASSVLDQNVNSMSGRTVTWASSVPARATVDQKGLVTAVSNGNTNITATDGAAVETQPITVADLAPTTMKIHAGPIIE